jgi:ubiquinol-cytochrome c reductase cytochrome b subunit
LIDWIDQRFPLTKLWREQVSEYYAPKNFNFWYYFGSLALLILVNQLVTGIFLTMNYNPSATGAFASVEYIMRDVDWGWLIRYMHSTGASAFFIVVYLHMFRALLYGSHRKPRELLWIFGCLIFLLLMAEAFMGYVLPWGNMSFWGAQVIVSLFGSLPVIGTGLVEWIRGDYVIGDATLNRFFALHVAALPIALIFLVIAHLMALHEVGSNNPDGIEIKKYKDADGHPLDGIPFHPYYTVKDLVGVAGFLVIFCGVIFFAPSFGGLFLEGPNFEPANPLQTPPHIAPVWYFTPFYAMLRAVPSFWGTQVWGVLVMGAAIVVLFFLPWLDRSPVRSIRYRGPLYKIMLTIFAAAFIALGVCGLKPPAGIYPMLARVCTALYFAFFLLMPWYTKFDSVKPVPERVTGHD